MSERQICDSNSGPCQSFDQSGQPMWYQREFESLGKPASNKQAKVDDAGSKPGELERVEHVQRTVADQLQPGQKQRGPQERGHHLQGQQGAPEARAQQRQRQEVQPPQGKPHADRRQGDRGQAHVPQDRQQIIDAWRQRQAAQEQANPRVAPSDNRQHVRRDQGDQRQHLRNDADGRRPDGQQVVRRPHVESPLDPRQQLDPRLLDQRQQQEQQRLAELQRRRQDQPGNRQTEIIEQQIRRQLETSNGRHVDQNLLRQLEQARRQQHGDRNGDRRELSWAEIQRQRQYLDAQRGYDQRQIDPRLLQQLLRSQQQGQRYDDWAYRRPTPGGSDYYDPRLDQRYSYDPRYDRGRNDNYNEDYNRDRWRTDPYDRRRYDDYARNDWDPRGWDPSGRDPYGRDPYGRDRLDPYGRDRWDQRDRGRNDIGRQLAASIIPMILGQVFNQIGGGRHHGGYDRYGGGYDRGGYDRYGHGQRPCPRGGGYQSFGRGGNNPLGMIMQVFRGF